VRVTLLSCVTVSSCNCCLRDCCCSAVDCSVVHSGVIRVQQLGASRTVCVCCSGTSTLLHLVCKQCRVLLLPYAHSVCYTSGAAATNCCCTTLQQSQTLLHLAWEAPHSVSEQHHCMLLGMTTTVCTVPRCLCHRSYTTTARTTTIRT
jgi:hypothetical protein